MPTLSASEDAQKKFMSVLAKKYLTDKQALIEDRSLQLIPAPTAINSDSGQPSVWGVFLEYNKAGN